MKTAALFFASVLGGAHAAALSQPESFEPAGFNATQELERLGVQVKDLPASSLSTRSLEQYACPAACLSLSAIFGRDSVVTENDDAYDQFTGAFWSEIQADVDPQCIFKPSKAEDVSVVVLLSRLTQCPFAVKSGGHAAFAGASNIEGGITVTFEKMQDVTVSCDKQKVKIQPGNTWGQVYDKLAKDEITVTGGRVGKVGTGGLTLGGGISYFSNKYGWACDNVLTYEVVTAAGFIINVTEKSNPSLYWALRGGGNNFGIVTAFTFRAIPLPGGLMWGGTKTYLENDFSDLTEAFVQTIANTPDDPNAGTWIAWLSQGGMKLAATEFWYATPEGADAAIWEPYENLTAIADSTKERTHHEYAHAQDESNPYGFREVYYGLTVKAGSEVAAKARDVFFEEQPKLADVEGANPVLIFQGITTEQIKHMSARGGNPLGINLADGPLYLIHVACWWSNAEDDERVYSWISNLLTRIESEASALGKQNDYIYMNYGSLYENVIANYGPDNVDKLNSIAKFYDPTAVFQKLQPGHFKLDRAPVPDDRFWSGVRS
ncbi:FAD binding domain-containing protein [Emericellopsis atlantica]|uniref:FAD binding domain-containing protein n=1 Tax=Emericellopsis atlantica TaxID=2614577 RepID=A0A9P7ZVU3_9HYPO|nr:FAD binding domain-containing protein [Emericellopsis atlantica]KAG9258787.1 FAD binding domain-containing protein [Emericellopsis atlantica]